ncbi:nitroreductase [Breznakibacter xylanolyticus]|uniref:Nitroreductase n=1 Tax=Breznakibacter xylanolyticus TaxID=990 RepID=A0A2W7NYV9_9BACT|nr:nitroreductase family protein [Breznakibacter xylanolyticus]MBN2744092.1 nitroreductase family protein [Marinilabiliaceae bacterium]PZX16382.1 nitroreductase [Breznakibacter xylanolyticus]
MNFQQLVTERFSVRSFKPAMVPDVLLHQVLEAGRLAPSACNNQPWAFVVIDAPEVLAKIHAAYPREWFAKTRQVIAVCGNHDQSWRRSYDGKDHCDIDVAIAVDHMTLMAADLGLGTCWVCHFNAQLVHDALSLPAAWEAMVLLPIGYPDVDGQPVKKRKPFDEVVFRNSFK